VLEATGGGTKRHLLELIQGTTASIQHIVACPQQRYPAIYTEMMLSELRDLNVEYHIVDMPRTISPWHDFKALLQLLRTLDDVHADLIHVHSAKAGFVGRLAARLRHKRPVPVIYTPHGLYFLGQAGWRRLLYWLMEYVASYFTDCTIALSFSEQAALISTHLATRDRIVLIENGIDEKKYVPPRWKGFHRRRLGLPSDGPIVGTVSRFAWQKDPETLFLTAKQLIQTVPKLHFIWCGDGDSIELYRRRAEAEQIHDRLHILGFRPDVKDVLCCLDLFITASRFEGLPYSVLEAMALAVPVVAIDVVGLRDVVLHDQTGVLVRTRSADDLAEVSHNLLTDPDRCRALGQKGRALVVEQFRLTKSLCRTEMLYHALARPCPCERS